ncbi:unnamed protein product [Prunus brigantina]
MHCARLYARGVDDEIEAALQKVEKALTESSWAIELQRMWRLRLDLWRKLLSCPNWLRKKFQCHTIAGYRAVKRRTRNA